MRSMILNHDLNEAQATFLTEKGYVLEWEQCLCGACDAEQHWFSSQIQEDSEEEDQVYAKLETLE